MADSTEIASLAVVLSGRMLVRREKVTAGGDIFSGVLRSGLGDVVLKDLEL